MSSDEEELSTGPRERGPLNRFGRLRLDLLVAAVILGGVIVVGRAMSREGGGTPKPTPTPSASAPVGGFGTGAPDPGSGLLNGAATFTVVASDGQPVVVPAVVPVGSGDPAACPKGIGCYSVASAPAPALAAVRAAFPAMILESATTVRLDVKNYGAALWFLQINGRRGGDEILVRLQATSDSGHDQHGTIRLGTQATTYYGHPLLQYYVYVEVHHQAGTNQPLAPLARLVRDVRLLDRG